MYTCPKCKAPLIKNNGSLRCASGHSFDISASGYVNLLLGSKTGNHGDSKEMIRARRDFLELGYYAPIIDTVSAILHQKFPNKQISVLDTGCGEGYYTERIRTALENPIIYGLDVSKDAIVYAAKRYKNIDFCVASNNALPFDDNSFDAILSLFAPLCEQEFARVLKPGGILITVSPSENHLFGLKKAIYSTPYKNPPSTFVPEILKKTEEKSYEWSIALSDSKTVRDLFMMTPYYHKSSPQDIEKALKLTSVNTEIGFTFCVYEKCAE